MEIDSDPCIIELAASVHNSKSPFDGMIVLGWFDGPTKGIVICNKHERAYFFRTLAKDDGSYDYDAWNEGKEIQIIGLTRLDPNMLGDIVETLSQTGPPRWPIWHRGPYKDPAAFEANRPADAKANALLDQIQHLDLVLAIPLGHLLDEILATRKIEPSTVVPDDVDGWFTFLGFSLEDPPRVHDEE